jgi:alanyl-tRNA synthetase
MSPDPRLEGAYPNLATAKKSVSAILEKEQEAFERTLERGLQLLEAALGKYGKILPGEVLFELYDTYGFPVDLAQLIAAERCCAVDLPAFERQMDLQRERARRAQKMEKISMGSLSSSATEFLGYTPGEVHQTVLQQILPRREGGCYLVLPSTPFYGEKGGQIGDRGTATVGGKTWAIIDTQCTAEGILLHAVDKEVDGKWIGDPMELRLDLARRQRIACHHTATHLLQEALRQILGTHVAQAGSAVTDSLLRFDFSHFQPLTEEQLGRAEALANRWIRQNFTVRTEEIAFENRPAHCLAHFGEKYGSRVRMVEAGPSTELCGGTHVAATGEIGSIKILCEGGIAAGVRRIEAVAGEAAHEFFCRLFQNQRTIALGLHCKESEVVEKFAQWKEKCHRDGKRIRALEEERTQRKLEDLYQHRQARNGRDCIAAFVDGVNSTLLRSMATQLAQRLPHGLILLGSGDGEKLFFVAACGKEAIGAGCSAKFYVENFMAQIQGRGGGKEDFAAGNAPYRPDGEALLQKFVRENL